MQHYEKCNLHCYVNNMAMSCFLLHTEQISLIHNKFISCVQKQQNTNYGSGITLNWHQIKLTISFKSFIRSNIYQLSFKMDLTYVC